MIRILQSISTREKTMLVAFIIVCLLIWASSLSRRWEDTSTTLSAAQRDLRQQQVWISNAPQFESRLQQVLSHLDPAKTLSAEDLVSLVDTLSRQAKLRHELATPQTRQGTLFNSNTLRVSFRNITLEDLVTFELQIREHFPYTTLSGLALSANQADPRLLNARLEITSFEIKEKRP